MPAVPWLVLPVPAQRYKTQRGYTVAPVVLIVSLSRLGLVSFMSGEATDGATANGARRLEPGYRIERAWSRCL